jgi:hypothetical protein
MPLPNSYFWYAKLSQQFTAEINIFRDFLKSTLKIEMRRESDALHFTLGLCCVDDSQIEPADQTTRRNQELVDALQEKINEASSFLQSMLLLPADLMVTDNGFLIITYKPLSLQHEGNIEKIHSWLMQNAEDQGLRPSGYMKDNFLPHISLGRIRFEEKGKIEFLLRNKKDLLLNRLLQTRPLNISNISLTHNVTTAKAVELVSCNFLRRDFGVISREFEDENATVKFLFKEENGAIACAEFLYQLGAFITQNALPLNLCDIVGKIIFAHEKQNAPTMFSFKLEVDKVRAVTGLVEGILLPQSPKPRAFY